MFEGKYGKALTIGLIVLVIVVLGVLVFFTIDFVRNNNTKTNGADGSEQFIGSVNRVKNNTQVTNQETITPNIQVENIISDGTSNGGENRLNGFLVVGVIEIPKIDAKYQILENASKDSIEVSVAINGGPGLNKVGNTIIIGHNYRNGTFFSNNKNLTNGDKIYITDTTGKKVEYTIFNIYTTEPEDSDYMDRETNGKREITLVTCTDDTKSRLIICASAD